MADKGWSLRDDPEPPRGGGVVPRVGGGQVMHLVGVVGGQGAGVGGLPEQGGRNLTEAECGQQQEKDLESSK